MARTATRNDQPDTDQPNTDQPTPDESGPDLAYLATLDESAEDMTDEDRAAFAALTDKQRTALAELRSIAAIESFTVPASDNDGEGFKKETTPVRTRNAVQVAMDKVAAKSYAAWVAADRPILWQKNPGVITYFLDPEAVPEYRKLIRRACEAVTADGDATGVRVRFGKEFVLLEKMAVKIGKPDAAGKTVLAWAAIDKRKNSKSNGDTDE